MERFAEALFLRRLAALLVLAGLLWLAAPLLLWPFAGLAERAEAIETEAALVDRLARQAARRASVASLATVSNPPFFVAPDAASAQGALQERVAKAAPPEALRIESLSLLPPEEKPGAPVEISLGFTATEDALYGFLAELETRPPFVRVRELSVKSGTDDAGRRVLAGTATLSAVPLIKARP